MKSLVFQFRQTGFEMRIFISLSIVTIVTTISFLFFSKKSLVVFYLPQIWDSQNLLN